MNYELVAIFQADKEEDKYKKAVKDVEKLVEGFKGKITKNSAMGKKDLAYKIKRQSQGFYHEFNLSLDSVRLPEFDRKLRNMESIIRYLLMRVKE